ncbi:glucuronate isomerase [Oceanivirga salmonicida]|uniref:glucuronate isomerase n=1 Tax=Oceanivirga salmonicida TaxID=1769291 RepID=UPI000AC2415E|nr:glucuronate isomerase [Oceanivirga salmonicida]
MFIDGNFMLHNEISKQLYKNIKDMPIFDYHCHLSPKEIAEDKPFENIFEIWLKFDHYKWRAMRANGILEDYITGNKTNYEKFLNWAKTLDKCLISPLYHWTAMELKKYFDITEILCEKNAKRIWEETNKIIRERKYSPKKLIEMSNVDVICTTDNPVDDLKYHVEIKKDSNFKTKIVPGFRPDLVYNIGTKAFYDFINNLEKVVEFKIESYADLLNALSLRIKFFDENNCFISDHGLSGIPYIKTNFEEVEKIFNRALKKEKISKEESEKYLTRLLIDLAKEYKKYNWTMQIHFGAIRNNNIEMFEKLGADSGFDSMCDVNELAYKLNNLLNEISNNGLPKMIIYNLEPSVNNIVACTIANFQVNFGKMQFGAAWWFNDTKEGMLRQIKVLADQGLLYNFVGMLTDSRSFVSYTRHEYFRRILCQYIGELVELGEIPNDIELLTRMLKAISYENAKKYFKKEKDI